MYRILKKKVLNPTVTLMEVEAPLIAAKAQPGQFIILRADKDGERIPLTISGCDKERGSVRIIFQLVGATTKQLGMLNEGDMIPDFVGPLGNPTPIDGLKKVCVVGGGVGCAIALPVAEKLHENGCEVHTIAGFRNKDLVILEDEFKACSDKYILMTDDGSAVIMAIGTSPNPLLKFTTKGLETKSWGGIVADESGQTSREGVFAGGDAVTGAATVILAMGEGKTAAAAIDEYIKNKSK